MTNVELVDRSSLIKGLYRELVLDPGQTAIITIDMHRGHLDMDVATMPTRPEDARRVIANARAALESRTTQWAPPRRQVDFGWIALRATGLGFLMITLALSQVVWGTAYRWASVTNGDNGLTGLTRPAPFGINLDDAAAFYYFALIITAVSLWMMARFVNSPFGAALRGTRDQPRRMSALSVTTSG